MIAYIDRTRKKYVVGITAAIEALNSLKAVDESFRHLDHAPTVQAIAEMNQAANAAIDARARASHEEGKAGSTINVTGDYIRVGDITDSENIAIGKDIEQGGKT
jgi:hypothetical protein